MNRAIKSSIAAAAATLFLAGASTGFAADDSKSKEASDPVTTNSNRAPTHCDNATNGDEGENCVDKTPGEPAMQQ